MPHCVITGAADGIGKALALHYAQAGYTITGVDRDTTRSIQAQAELTRLGAQANFITADLAAPTAISEISARLVDGPAIDVLVHNAGINAVGRFGQLDIEQQQTVVDINLEAAMLLTSALLRKRRIVAGGTLVFIASLSVFVSYPSAAVYAATKEGLAAYARSLAAALAPQRINVLTVYPGPTRTAHARRYSLDNRREGRRMPPEKLAALIYQAVQKRQRRLVPGLGNQFFVVLGRYVPALAEFAMRKSLFDRLP